jgi:hypothetical protein
MPLRSLPYLPLDVWYDILGLLDIDDAIAFSKADPRFLGAFIQSKKGIRFRNALNSYMRSNAVYLAVGPISSFVCKVLRGSSLDFSSLISWICRRFRPVLSSSIVVNPRLFADLSSTIALKDHGFISKTYSLYGWTVELKAGDSTFSSVSWILIYRASISGYDATDFHRACDGMGNCVVVVKAANGRIAAAYNEDGFTSVDYSRSLNLNGFIVTVDEQGGCREIFHRIGKKTGLWNNPVTGPVFGDAGLDLCISNNCHQNEHSWSSLGTAYGRKGPGVDDTTLFGQRYFQVVDYEVFKIVIE